MNIDIIFHFAVPLIFIVIGIFAWFTAPLLKPNGIIGFRTNTSRKSNESFLYANKKMGIFFITSGIIALILDIFLYIFFRNFTETSFIIPLLAPIISIPFMLKIESNLKKLFK
ncbi:MAG: SdpI family protein [Clostridium sp.]